MSGTFVALFGGIPAGPEVLVILLIVVLLFGAQKIPKLARSTGEAMGEFQKGREEVEEELKEMRDSDKEEPAAEPADTADTTDTAATESAEETSKSSE